MTEAPREKIARVIDPRAFEMDETFRTHRTRDAVAAAFTKADAILSLIPSEDWQDISTAPRDGTHIILAFGQDGVMEGWWIDDDNDAYPWKFVDQGLPNSTARTAGGFINGSREVRGGPTHWRPLPTPPISTGDET